MVKARREANLAMEPLRSERGGDLGEQDFERATGRSCRRGVGPVCVSSRPGPAWPSVARLAADAAREHSDAAQRKGR
jgi:hypothetical protein